MHGRRTRKICTEVAQDAKNTKVINQCNIRMKVIGTVAVDTTPSPSLLSVIKNAKAVKDERMNGTGNAGAQRKQIGEGSLPRLRRTQHASSEDNGEERLTPMAEDGAQRANIGNDNRDRVPVEIRRMMIKEEHQGTGKKRTNACAKIMSVSIDMCPHSIFERFEHDSSLYSYAIAGLGKRLLDHALSWATSNGSNILKSYPVITRGISTPSCPTTLPPRYTDVCLSTSEFQVGAQRLYCSAGFKKIGHWPPCNHLEESMNWYIHAFVHCCGCVSVC